MHTSRKKGQNPFIISQNTMRTLKLLLTILLFAETIFAQNSEDIVIAKGIKINSRVLGEERTIYVSVSSGYDDSKDSYQVLYVIDGVTEVIGLVKYLSDYGVCPQLIIVTIAEVNPSRDLFPSKPKGSRGPCCL